jgi:hypothetical protein
MIDDAAIAYDAWQDRREGFDYAKLVAIALEHYAATFPRDCPYRTFFTERCGGGEWRNHKMDVYCTFCGGLLVARIGTAANPSALPKVVRHTTGCALACLAGLRDMVVPGTHGLIDEDRTA